MQMCVGPVGLCRPGRGGCTEPPPLALSSKFERSLVSSISLKASLQRTFNGNNAHKFVLNKNRINPRAQLSLPLIPPNDQWGTWTTLLTAGAIGIWSEKTKWGSTLSGALVSALIGLAASNLGIVASQAPAYAVVNGYLLPLAVPLLLYTADMRRVIASTGRLLMAFCIGSVATTLGTLVAYQVLPMRSLGQDGWKIAAALMSRHIGGETQLESGDKHGNRIPVLESTMALALSCIICTAGTYLAKLLQFEGGGITCITALVVVLATLFPSQIGSLAPAGEALAVILMQVFFAVVGASGSIANVVKTAPSIFFFSLIQIAVHLAVILGLGRVLGFDKKQLLIASNANVGGPTTACGMAVAKGWKTLMIPGILAGIFGISIATFLAIAFGMAVLKHM